MYKPKMTDLENIVNSSSGSDSCGSEELDRKSPERECSSLQLQEILQLANISAAILNSDSGEIVWCTPMWMTSFPEMGIGESWSKKVEARHDCHELMQAFNRNQSNTASVHCEPANTTMQLTLQVQGEGTVALVLSEPEPEPESEKNSLNHSMHHYMQARESMFTTSRTISVSEMATTLAHEIKQPIATITNMLKGVRIHLNRGDTNKEAIEIALTKALEQAEFTNSVINRIRDFTQARRPKQHVLDIVVVLKESLSLMDWFLSTNQCRVECDLTEEVLICEGDPTMLQQVVGNLLRNGVEAMLERNPEDRLLMVSCQRRKETIRVSIRDFGHGLQGKEESLFVPFTTTKANGMGVGLNICRSFIELHQGRLWLSPNKEGGCTSHIELPLNSTGGGSV